ncbi:MAG: hypothetical protein OXG68_02230 [Chloroflexi bacterium]|nr:hypothetical protein [Chloroflexota bacterium]
MKIETLLQDVNIVLDWHDNGDFLDCYQEADDQKVKKVLMIWRGSIYYAAAREFIQQHFEVVRRAVKENKMYRRELSKSKPMSFDDWDFVGIDFYLDVEGMAFWEEHDSGEDALARAQALIASGEYKADDIEVREDLKITRCLSIEEAIDQYGEIQPA